jgi:transposase
MGSAIRLRDDFDGPALRRLARRSRNASQGRRLMALAEIYDGRRRSDAARTGCVGLQIIRDWVLRFNARGPAGLINRKAAGPKRKLDDAQRQALADIVERGPIPAIHEVVRWRRCDLAQWVWEEFGISLSEATVGRELRALGFRRISARPRHYAQNELAIDVFKKDWPCLKTVLVMQPSGDPMRPRHAPAHREPSAQ